MLQVGATGIEEEEEELSGISLTPPQETKKKLLQHISS
jgi:hypothetical protein